MVLQWRKQRKISPVEKISPIYFSFDVFYAYFKESGELLVRYQQEAMDIPGIRGYFPHREFV